MGRVTKHYVPPQNCLKCPNFSPLAPSALASIISLCSGGARKTNVFVNVRLWSTLKTLRFLALFAKGNGTKGTFA